MGFVVVTQDMRSTATLSACWTCGKRVRDGLLVATREGETHESKDLPRNFRPIVWRYVHDTDECFGEPSTIHVAFPSYWQHWIETTIRLLDAKGSWWLFEMTNWRYVFECVNSDVVSEINNFTNPSLARRPKRARVELRVRKKHAEADQDRKVGAGTDQARTRQRSGDQAKVRTVAGAAPRRTLRRRHS